MFNKIKAMAKEMNGRRFYVESTNHNIIDASRVISKEGVIIQHIEYDTDIKAGMKSGQRYKKHFIDLTKNHADMYNNYDIVLQETKNNKVNSTGKALGGSLFYGKDSKRSLESTIISVFFIWRHKTQSPAFYVVTNTTANKDAVKDYFINRFDVVKKQAEIKLKPLGNEFDPFAFVKDTQPNTVEDVTVVVGEDMPELKKIVIKEKEAAVEEPKQEKKVKKGIPLAKKINLAEEKKRIENKQTTEVVETPAIVVEENKQTESADDMLNDFM